MASIRVKMNSKGAAAILKSPQVLANLESRGNRIADAAGGAPDFEVTSTIGKNRARVSIITSSIDGMRAEAEDRALTRALDAGRG